jgi:hypothetical protein
MTHLITSPFPIPMTTVVSPTALVPTIFNPYVISPLNPLIPRYPSVVAYQDVNNDRNLKVQVVAYFYTKITNNWLKYHYLDLYNMLHINNGKITIKNNSNENNSKDDNENDIKCKYIINNYITKNDLLKLLSKFRKMNGLNWWDLRKYSDKVRSYIHHKIKEAIRSDITN